MINAGPCCVSTVPGKSHLQRPADACTLCTLYDLWAQSGKCLLALQVANAWLHILDPLLVAYAVNVLVVFGYLHYVVTVVGEICAFLDIPCLTIRQKKEAPHAE